MTNIKECYELSLGTGLSQEAKEILRAKIKKLAQKEIPDPVPGDPAEPTKQEMVSKLLLMLTEEEETHAFGSGFSGQFMMDTLPESGEKEYLGALLELRKGRGETQRLEALRHITNALRLSPGDPRFLALAEVLKEVEVL